MTVSIAPSSRQALVDWYRRNRQRSRALFDLIDPDVYFTRPIALRNPIVFYEGHLPAFSVISFLKRGLGRAGVDERLETLFARGIDPDSEQQAVPRSGADTRWPSRAAILDYARAADDEIVAAMERAEFDVTGREHAAMADGEAIFTALEHEAMHQETLLYMWRRLPYAHKQKPHDLSYELGAAPPPCRRIDIPAGRATLGARRPSARADRSSIGAVVAFGWDNEFDALAVDVPGFDIDAHSVTNAEFLEFIADRGYQRRELWDDPSWEWREAEQVGHPAFWSRSERQRRRCLGLARHVRRDSAAARLARLRQSGGGCGVRALEGTPAADRGRVSPRRVWQPRWRGARIPVGRRAAAAGARQFRFPVVGAGAGRRASGGRERVGRARSRRQRLGVDRQRVCAVPRLCARCRRTRNTPPSSSMAATSC